jgi:hypothetical protein
MLLSDVDKLASACIRVIFITDIFPLVIVIVVNEIVLVLFNISMQLRTRVMNTELH